MGYRHSREEIVAAAAAVTLEHGLAGLTFAKVAERLGISDRMVVYYLPTKPDLVIAAATELGAQLQQLLEEAFGAERQPPDTLLRRAWPVLTTATAARTFDLFFEVIGLASARQPPYDALAPAMVGSWADWLADRTEGSSVAVRRRRALGVMARIDGLLLLHRTVGPEAAALAAKELGVA